MTSARYLHDPQFRVLVDAMIQAAMGNHLTAYDIETAAQVASDIVTQFEEQRLHDLIESMKAAHAKEARHGVS